MRILLLPAMFVLCAPATSAFAAKGQDASATAAETTPQPLVLEKSGVADVDAVFNKADEPIGTLNKVRVELTNVRDNLAAALSLPAGTPFQDSITDLKNKAGATLNLAVSEQGLPKLEPTDAVPANVQAAANAVNGGMVNLEHALVALAEVPRQLEEVTSAAMAVDPMKVEATKIPKVTKVTKHNLNVLAQADDEAKAITAELDAMKTSIETAFQAL